jgi:ribonuclease BN (tRNA processing enzyme)
LGEIAATHWFAVEVLHPFGLTRYHLMFIIDLPSRRVCIGGITFDPCGRWMKNVMRRMTDCFDGFLVGKRYLIHDRDPLRSPSFDATAVQSVLCRDARRHARGRLSTCRAARTGGLSTLGGRTEVPRPGPGMLPPISANSMCQPLGVHVPSTQAVLLNGINGDPLLQVRLRHRRRILLFDVGDAGRLSARIAHQVTDVFISHTHFHHIAGFLCLLRSRTGITEPCRLHRPAWLADHIEGFLVAIHWDRIGDRAPRFHVAELHGPLLNRYKLQAGRLGRRVFEPLPVAAAVLPEEPAFRVRTALLDHPIPSVTFALEESQHLNIRKEGLRNSRLAPRPWLNEIRTALHRHDPDTLFLLANGTRRTAGELASELVVARPGEKMVYATDLDATPAKREALIPLASGAHTLFCEASFATADAEQARSTKHLTARACAQTSAAAGVQQLCPFHFSRRYEQAPKPLCAELGAAFPNLLPPRALARGSV